MGLSSGIPSFASGRVVCLQSFTLHAPDERLLLKLLNKLTRPSEVFTRPGQVGAHFSMP
jgi:hypothetical protein